MCNCVPPHQPPRISEISKLFQENMSSLAISMVSFLCVFGAALLGMLVSPKLPIPHQSSESKDVVRLAMGLVATTVAVALGLLVSSAKTFYDTQSNEVTQFAANYILLDQVLAFYGPETKDARSGLRDGLANLLDYAGDLQGSSNSNRSYVGMKSGARVGGDFVADIQGLSPKDDTQRSLKAQALSIVLQLSQTRWLIFEQNAVPVPALLLYMLFGWLMVLFLSFGIFAPRNFTVIAGLLLAALAVCGAILLILAMYHPQAGPIKVSDGPLRAALAQLGH